MLINNLRNIIQRNITLWRVLKFISLITIFLVVYNIGVEAKTLQDAYVWLKTKILKISWQKPATDCNHYRVEVSKTNLLSEPLLTNVYYEYTREQNLQLELDNDHSYQFRIQGISSYGTLSDFSDSSSLFIYNGGESAKKLLEDKPSEFSLSQNYPNPFNNITKIDYQIPESVSNDNVNLTIYNVLGQKVKVLVNENQIFGNYNVTWDGRDDGGRTVSSGHYIYSLSTGNFRVSKKMILMK